MDPYIQYMQDHPPRCIVSCAAVPTDEMAAFAGDDYGTYASIFQIRNEAGQREWLVWGASDAGDAAKRSPVLVGSAQRDHAVFVFDETCDGYNGEFGLSDDSKEVPVYQTAVNCPECGADRFNLTAVFQYSGDNEELNEDDLIARRQDFFAWFALLGCCTKCPWKGVIANVECA